MPGAVIANPYISVNEQGRAVVTGTRSKVTMIARDHIAGGMTAQQIHEAYPHLSLAAIHAALSFYYDHRAELDAEIARGDAEADRIMAAVETSGRLSKDELQRRADAKAPRP